MTGFDYAAQTPELRAAIDTVAGMGNTEFAAAAESIDLVARADTKRLWERLS